MIYKQGEVLICAAAYGSDDCADIVQSVQIVPIEKGYQDEAVAKQMVQACSLPLV